VTLPAEEVAAETIARVHREEWARVVAVLTRRFGDLDIAEEMTAEAFAVAVERWPTDGVPPIPAPGSPRPLTGVPSTGCAASPVVTTSRRRLRCCTTTPRLSRPTSSRRGRSRTTGSG
jgi:hypothetical protein